MYIHTHVHRSSLTLPTSNSQSNWSYLLGVNQEESGYQNKEHLKIYSYHLEKQLIYHAFFKRAQGRRFSPATRNITILLSKFPFPLLPPPHFNLKDLMTNSAGQALSSYGVLESLEPGCGPLLTSVEGPAASLCLLISLLASSYLFRCLLSLISPRPLISFFTILNVMVFYLSASVSVGPFLKQGVVRSE